MSPPHPRRDTIHPCAAGRHMNCPFPPRVSTKWAVPAGVAPPWEYARLCTTFTSKAAGCMRMCMAVAKCVAMRVAVCTPRDRGGVGGANRVLVGPHAPMPGTPVAVVPAVAAAPRPAAKAGSAWGVAVVRARAAGAVAMVANGGVPAATRGGHVNANDGRAPAWCGCRCAPRRRRTRRVIVPSMVGSWSGYRGARNACRTPVQCVYDTPRFRSGVGGGAREIFLQFSNVWRISVETSKNKGKSMVICGEINGSFVA